MHERKPEQTAQLWQDDVGHSSWVLTLSFILGSVILLTLAAAPFGLWFLAWFALSPWLVLVARARSAWRAAVLGWLTGSLYFAANLWWLWTASVPGTVVLILYFGLYWSLAAAIIRALDLLPLKLPATSLGVSSSGGLVWRVFAISSVWVACEWLRCYVASGFAWLPLGTTQTPVVAMCQVADLGGPWIVSFCVMMTNALAALAWLGRRDLRRLYIASATVGVLLLLVAVYGIMRIQSTPRLPGPRVMVLQSNFPHLPGGAPSVDVTEAVRLHFEQLEQSLKNERVDLVVLPEAAFPPINEEARSQLAPSAVGPFLESTHQRLLDLAGARRTALLIGGTAVTRWTRSGRERIGREIRNSAYFYDPAAEVGVTRYDKIFLARFSERAPLAVGPDWLRRLAAMISASRASQPMFAGELAKLQPFELRWDAARGASESIAVPRADATEQETARFLAPICLENIDPRIMAKIMRGPDAYEKRADFLANLSNDGWFAWQEKHQHLQTTVFRCIENRVPMARSSNTGISCFIDSAGRVHNALAPARTGFSMRQLALDNRVTPYMQYGDVFAFACILLTAVLVGGRAIATAGRPFRRISASGNSK